jgi:hypothetical protein
MAKLLRASWAAGIVASGMLLGHIIAYALEGRSRADGHHAYFSPLLEVAVASALLGSGLFAGRKIGSRALHRVHALPPLSHLWFIVALLQTVGYVALELLEGNTPDALGCSVQIFVALLVAVAMTLFCRVIERCAQALSCSYTRRLSSSTPALPSVIAPVDGARALSVRAGIRRFKRPPPLIS